MPRQGAGEHFVMQKKFLMQKACRAAAGQAVVPGDNRGRRPTRLVTAGTHHSQHSHYMRDLGSARGSTPAGFQKGLARSRRILGASLRFSFVTDGHPR